MIADGLDMLAFELIPSSTRSMIEVKTMPWSSLVNKYVTIEC